MNQMTYGQIAFLLTMGVLAVPVFVWLIRDVSAEGRRIREAAARRATAKPTPPPIRRPTWPFPALEAEEIDGHECFLRAYVGYWEDRRAQIDKYAQQAAATVQQGLAELYADSQDRAEAP